MGLFARITTTVRRRLVDGMTVVRRRLFASFQTKFLALVLASVLLPSGVLWVFSVRDTERFQTAQTEARFQSVLQATHREINYWYKDRIGDLERLLQSAGFLNSLERYYLERDPAVRDYHKREINKYFAIVGEKFPVYEQFIVLDMNGRLIVSNVDVSRETRAMLDSLRGKARVERYVAPAQLSESRDAFFQWILVPVEISKKATATACVKMRLSGIKDLLDAEEVTTVADLFLLDRNGRFLTQPRIAPFNPTTGETVNMVGEHAMRVPSPDQAGTAIIEKYTKESLSRDGKRRQRTKFLGSKLYLANQQWWLVCEAEESLLVAPVVTRKNRILFANFLVCALFLLAAWRMSRHLLNPLAELSLGAGRINQGMVGVHIPGGGDDEIGHMISAFNDMAKRISVSEAELQAKAKQLQSKNDELVGMNDKLERLSVTDGLTGLFNHRHFWNLMNNELSRASLYHGELGLVLLDVDNFKKVNDKFGHGTGDLLIQRIADVLRETVRQTDMIARYGGEEFAILFPDASRDGVLAVSEKVREAVEVMVFKVPETDITVSVTVSVGVSIYRGNRREFFNAADRALYASKAKGKNQVRFAMADK
ncbi:MAG: diguanylate cyclase [Candidatus Krumholzibacteriia bacterium]